MSEPRIIPPKKARALLEAATPGPWQEFGTEWNDDGQMVSGYVSTASNYPDVDISGDGIPAADAQLIAAAPDLAHTAAVLGEEVEALRAKLATAWTEGFQAGWDEHAGRVAQGDTASRWWEGETVNPYRTQSAEKPGQQYATSHHWTPSSPTNPFGPKDTCMVMLARYVCPYSKEQHPPGPPEKLDVFGYRRKGPE